MMAFPVSGSWPTVYLPSHRPSFRFRMFPSPFARLFGMVSAPFATNNTVIKGTKLPKSGIVIKKLSFALDALSLSMATQFLRCRRRRFFGYSGMIFERPRSLSIDHSGAKYTRFPQKIAAIRNHFFGWLKRAISSTACGTSTLKSPLLRAFFTPHGHSRLRKRLSRCTLDCGSKASESPALRGFVGGPRALATAALYLVIFSNGDISPQNTFKTGINAP